MIRPEVSIVIPTFNRADFLNKAIDSALAQTYNCEVIVCDHGSSDNTPMIVREYGDTVKYIRRENDYGVHFCWLEGIINASGEYIHINYDDDWIAPEFIEETIKLMNTDVAFVFTAVKMVQDSKVKNRKSFNTFREQLYKDAFQTGLHSARTIENYLMLLGNLISPGCAIYRKTDLIDNIFVGGIPGASCHYKGVGSDLLFSLMPLLKYKKVGFVKKELAFFRVHDNSITVNAFKKNRKEIIKAYDEARKFYLRIKLINNKILTFPLYINFMKIILFRIIKKIIK